MDGGTSRDATEDDAGDNGVPRVRESAFAGDEDHEHEVGQEVRAEEGAGDHDGDEVQHEQRQRVIGVEREGRRSTAGGVCPASMNTSEVPGAVEEVAVGVKSECLARGEEDGEVLEDLPGQRQGGGRLEERLAGEEAEAKGDAGLDGGEQEDVEDGEGDELEGAICAAPAAPARPLGDAGVTGELDAGGQTGHERVEAEEE